MTEHQQSMLPWRLAVSLAAVIVLVVTANLASAWVVEHLSIEITPRNEPFFHRMIMGSAMLYAVLMAVPFVPGVEIGIGLLTLVGSGLAGLVYGCTVLGLSLSFFVGRFVSEAWLRAAFRFLHLRRMESLLERLQPLSRDERIALLVEQAPARAVAFLVTHRYVAVAVALNMPGNALIGGGGGIAMLAGVSRLFSMPRFLLTVMMAVAPVPLAVAIFGRDVLV